VASLTAFAKKRCFKNKIRLLADSKIGRSTQLLTGDWKVPGTRRQECLRHVAQAFQPAGSGDFPVASDYHRRKKLLASLRLLM
jgi:hypothetical protein